MNYIMPQKKMNRNQRAKTIVGALGGGRRLKKATAKTITGVRKGAKAAGGNKAAGKASARAFGGAIKQAAKTKMGREKRKEFFG